MHPPSDLVRYTRTVPLKDGTPVLVRPARDDDRERVVRAFGELEPESVYARFFSPKKELSEADLARVVACDFVNVLTLVATVPRGDDEVIIGVGTYAVVDRPDQPQTAEVSFTVEEDYQGQGLATRLLATLTEIAREHGIRRFEAEVLSSNRSMLEVFQHSGLPMQRHREGGVIHVAMDIPVVAPEAP